MSEETIGQPAAPAAEETYELVFRNGALKNLKALASGLGIAETDLKQVVNKAISALTLIKNGNFTIVEDEKGNRFRMDLNRL